MYTKEQEEQAPTEFKRTGSAVLTARQLGYPAISTRYRWFERREVGLKNNHVRVKPSTDGNSRLGYTAEHVRYPSAQRKLKILHLCFEIGEDVEYVSRETGYSRTSIYKWRRRYLENGVLDLMPSLKDIARRSDALADQKDAQAEISMKEMQKQLHDMQLEIDILKETINVLKKDPGADMTELGNHEKVQIVGVMKMTYPLHELLTT